MKKTTTIFTALVIVIVQSISIMAQTGGALNFDGSNDEVQLGNWFNYQNFTIEMWVNPGASQNSYANIIDNAHGGF